MIVVGYRLVYINRSKPLKLASNLIDWFDSVWLEYLIVYLEGENAWEEFIMIIQRSRKRSIDYAQEINNCEHSKP